jgi:hypothetical protein
LIIIPSSAGHPAGTPTPSAKQSAKALGRDPDLDPEEPAEPASEKIILETSKRTGKRASKALVEWSEGLELDVARMIFAKNSIRVLLWMTPFIRISRRILSGS